MWSDLRRRWSRQGGYSCTRTLPVPIHGPCSSNSCCATPRTCRSVTCIPRIKDGFFSIALERFQRSVQQVERGRAVSLEFRPPSRVQPSDWGAQLAFPSLHRAGRREHLETPIHCPLRASFWFLWCRAKWRIAAAFKPIAEIVLGRRHRARRRQNIVPQFQA